MTATSHTGRKPYTVVCQHSSGEYREVYRDNGEALLDAYYQSRESGMAAAVLLDGEVYARVIAGEAITDDKDDLARG